jgi:hypothetical protein
LGVGFGSAPDSGSKPVDGWCGISSFEFGKAGSSITFGVGEGSWASMEIAKPKATNKSFTEAFIPFFKGAASLFSK